MHTEISKDQRVQIRLDAISKAKLIKASSYMHKTISQFVLTQALAAADKIIEQERCITLSDDDWKIFFKDLENSPEPNQKLQIAAKRFQSKIYQ